MRSYKVTTPLLAAAALGLTAATAGTAAAQFTPPVVQTPTTSPYLNMLRQNNPQYLNYYGLVQPQLQTGAALGGLQQQLGTLNQTVTNVYNGAGGTAGSVTTGHAFGYFTHRSYFMTLGGGVGGRTGSTFGGGGGGGTGGAFGSGIGGLAGQSSLAGQSAAGGVRR